MNKIFNKLGARYPILLGGMTFVSEHNLVSAACNAGIIGVLSTGHKSTPEVKNEILKTKEMTDKPFGINLMVDSKNINSLIKLIIKSHVQLVTLGNGNVTPYIQVFKENGIKVFAIAPSVKIAKFYESSGVDALIVEGNEAGGHIGRNSTITLLPQVVNAVKIPVIAAGGISNGHVLAAVACMGAAGAQIGTLFAVSKESTASTNYKNAILNSTDTDSAITGEKIGSPIRGIKNSYTNNFRKKENLFDKGRLDRDKVSILAKNSLKNAYLGDVINGSIMAGSNSGLIKNSYSIKKQIDILYQEFNKSKKELSEFQ